MAVIAIIKSTSEGVIFLNIGDDHRPSIFANSGKLVARNGENTAKNARQKSHDSPTLALWRPTVSMTACLSKLRGGDISCADAANASADSADWISLTSITQRPNSTWQGQDADTVAF